MFDKVSITIEYFKDDIEKESYTIYSSQNVILFVEYLATTKYLRFWRNWRYLRLNLLQCLWIQTENYQKWK